METKSNIMRRATNKWNSTSKIFNGAIKVLNSKKQGSLSLQWTTY